MVLNSEPQYWQSPTGITLNFQKFINFGLLGPVHNWSIRRVLILLFMTLDYLANLHFHFLAAIAALYMAMSVCPYVSTSFKLCFRLKIVFDIQCF